MRRLQHETSSKRFTAVRGESTWTDQRAARRIKRSPTSSSRLAANVFAGTSLPLWVFEWSDSGASEASPPVRTLRLLTANPAAVAYHNASSEIDLRSTSTEIFFPRGTLNAIASAARKLVDKGFEEIDISLGRVSADPVRTHVRIDRIVDGARTYLAMMAFPGTPSSNLLRAISDLVFELDENGVFVDVAGPQDQALCSPHEWIGKSLTETLPPEVAHRTLAALQRLREHGGTERLEYALALSDGVHWFEAHLTALGNGATAHVRDISRQKSAELQARECEQRFVTLADSAPIIVWMTDRNGACTFINRAGLQFTGRTLEQERGDGWIADLHPDDLPRSLALLQEHSRSHRPFRIEHRLRRFDGTYRWFIEHAAPRFSPHGEFLGFVGTRVDITDSKMRAGAS